MTPYVADTHALFWYLTDSSKLGAQASQIFEEADQGRALIYVPVIVLAELYYLNEKRGRPLDFRAEYERLSQSGQFVMLPLTPEDALELEVDRAVPEMHDRMIVGAARRLGVPCLTRDPEIAASGRITAVW